MRDVGDVITIRLPGQPPRRFLVTATRPAGEDSVDLSLLIDPEDDDGTTVLYYRAVRR